MWVKSDVKPLKTVYICELIDGGVSSIFCKDSGIFQEKKRKRELLRGENPTLLTSESQ